MESCNTRSFGGGFLSCGLTLQHGPALHSCYCCVIFHSVDVVSATHMSFTNPSRVPPRVGHWDKGHADESGSLRPPAPTHGMRAHPDMRCTRLENMQTDGGETPSEGCGGS